MISDHKLDFWIKNNFNLLIEGHAGVGKTTIVIEAFKRNNLKWLYFSASTMDPWVDFIGVPKEKTDDDGNSYLDLIRPKAFRDDDVEAIFLDEFNRSHKKVRNAVMELIQFKSINGKKFNNLKIIWAAINPDGDDKENSDDRTYDVEPLDPAQKDRFHIHLEMPYKCHLPYFRQQFGDQTAISAIDWWNDLPKDIQMEVSPRRLDYALRVYTAGGDLRDVLPSKCNVSKLMKEIESGSLKKRVAQLFDQKDTDGAKEFLTDPNNYVFCKDMIFSKKFIDFFAPILDNEKLSEAISKNKVVQDFCLAPENLNQYADVLRDIAKAGGNRQLGKRIMKALPKQMAVGKTKIQKQGSLRRLFNTTSTDQDTDAAVKAFAAALNRRSKYNNTYHRKAEFISLCSQITQNLTTDTAIKVLYELNDKIFERTQFSTLNQHGYSDIFPLVNHCIMCVVENEQCTVKDVVVKINAKTNVRFNNALYDVENYLAKNPPLPPLTTPVPNIDPSTANSTLPVPQNSISYNGSGLLRQYTDTAQVTLTRTALQQLENSLSKRYMDNTYNRKKYFNRLSVCTAPYLHMNLH